MNTGKRRYSLHRKKERNRETWPSVSFFTPLLFPTTVIFHLATVTKFELLDFIALLLPTRSNSPLDGTNGKATIRLLTFSSDPSAICRATRFENFSRLSPPICRFVRSTIRQREFFRIFLHVLFKVTDVYLPVRSSHRCGFSFFFYERFTFSIQNLRILLFNRVKLFR